MNILFARTEHAQIVQISGLVRDSRTSHKKRKNTNTFHGRCVLVTYALDLTNAYDMSTVQLNM